ncbi:B12-binding domain-containing radical SAM protein [Roseateles koreensis]|uniref:Radical SAM core domain-containing protein n=1 Tax=Roseateles koreensis TaxID=2987526 RepID=A0ABT5KM53_9BURK|nr:radical SAM protein [Roseateles koreensis]MDC8783912.1 hypothetical protein [Roseateles koreensis]
MPLSKKPKVLIVNCYSDNNRGARGNPDFVPQSIAPLALAGVFEPGQVEIRVACEFQQGPMEDLRLLAWPDLLVLTGLNASLDRMKHLCAYAQSLNPSVCVAMGGPLARVLPLHCRQFFDEVLPGDVEDLAPLAADLFGPHVIAPEPGLRHDLAPPGHRVAYAEASRNCNFSCSFCAMTAEGRAYQPHDLGYIRRQLMQLGHKPCVMFLDQNFAGGPRAGLMARLALLREFHDSGQLQGWAALVTSDFFARPEMLEAARISGCIGFFSGVESLDPTQLRGFGKKQNLSGQTLERIERCLGAGMTFHYGLIHDPVTQHVQQLLDEVTAIAATPSITLPSFVSLAIPLLGTPLFQARLREGSLLPGIRLRDMDGRTLLTHSLDDPEQARCLVARMDRGLVGCRAALAHGMGFLRRYAGRMQKYALLSALSPNLAQAFPALGTAARDWHLRASAPMRSHVAGAEALGTLYRPLMPLASRYARYFEPVCVTDGRGALHEDLQADLGAGVQPLTAQSLQAVQFSRPGGARPMARSDVLAGKNQVASPVL